MGSGKVESAFEPSGPPARSYPSSLSVPYVWFNPTCNRHSVTIPPGHPRDKLSPSGPAVGNLPKRSCPGGRGVGQIENRSCEKTM